MKLSLRLLSAAAFLPLASADYETVFTFKKDFFLRFCGLSVGMGPDDGEALLAGLNDQAAAFKAVWKAEIKKLQNNKCEVVGVSINCLLFIHCDVSLLLLTGFIFIAPFIYRTFPLPYFPIAIGSIPIDTTLTSFRLLASAMNMVVKSQAAASVTISASSTTWWISGLDAPKSYLWKS